MPRVHQMFRALVAAAVAAALAFPASPAPAGPINPPAGPVAPTGKPLDQIEPRTPISEATTPGDAAALFRITQPGSYYLTGNITGEPGKHGIMIASSGVTLDLCGFALLGVPGSNNGVSMAGFFENVVIQNGHARNWGGSGIHTMADSGRIERINSDRNGAWGIDNGSSPTFTTHIISCEANNNLAGGIRGAASSHVTGCVVRGNAGAGIVVTYGGSVSGCNVRMTHGRGIIADTYSLVTDNTVVGSTGASGDGIHLTGNGNRVENNNVAACTGFGFRANAGGNFIVRNSAQGNTGGNYSFVGPQTAGPIITASGTIADAVSPWANFSY